MDWSKQKYLRKEIDWVCWIVLTALGDFCLSKGDDYNSRCRLCLIGNWNEMYLGHADNFESSWNQKSEIETPNIAATLLPAIRFDTHCYDRVLPVHLQCDCQSSRVILVVEWVLFPNCNRIQLIRIDYSSKESKREQRNRTGNWQWSAAKV